MKLKVWVKCFGWSPMCSGICCVTHFSSVLGNAWTLTHIGPSCSVFAGNGVAPTSCLAGRAAEEDGEGGGVAVAGTCLSDASRYPCSEAFLSPRLASARPSRMETARAIAEASVLASSLHQYTLCTYLRITPQTSMIQCWMRHDNSLNIKEGLAEDSRAPAHLGERTPHFRWLSLLQHDMRPDEWLCSGICLLGTPPSLVAEGSARAAAGPLVLSHTRKGKSPAKQRCARTLEGCRRATSPGSAGEVPGGALTS